MASKQVGRWRRVRHDYWELRACGQVRATITGERAPSGRGWIRDFAWTAGDTAGTHTSLYGAQRAARKALAEPGGPQATAGGKGEGERDA